MIWSLSAFRPLHHVYMPCAPAMPKQLQLPKQIIIFSCPWFHVILAALLFSPLYVTNKVLKSELASKTSKNFLPDTLSRLVLQIHTRQLVRHHLLCALLHVPSTVRTLFCIMFTSLTFLWNGKIPKGKHYVLLILCSCISHVPDTYLIESVHETHLYFGMKILRTMRKNVCQSGRMSSRTWQRKLCIYYFI